MKIDLQKLWECELDILEHFDQFCRNNGLKYSLAYGTLLGAVRHGGFIPWDDDIDVIMPRKDYEYLVNNWDVKVYIVQNKRTNDDFNQNFTKIRKDHTAFIQFEFEKYTSYHKGIFIDIFPGDHVAPSKFQRKIQFAFCAVNLLYSREGIVSRKLTLGEKALLAIPRKWRLAIRNWSEIQVQRWNNCNTEYMFPSPIKDAKIYCDNSLFDRLIDIRFCGRTFKGTKDYDCFLHQQYGDYMVLPDEKERVYTHHPLFVSYDQNYGEH